MKMQREVGKQALRVQTILLKTFPMKRGRDMSW